jgi:hypothetical protein
VTAVSQVKQTHLPSPTPRVVNLYAEKWKLAFVDNQNFVWQTVRYRDMVLWSGKELRIAFLLRNGRRIGLKVRDTSNIQAGREFVTWLAEHVRALSLAIDKNPRVKQTPEAVLPIAHHALGDAESTEEEVAAAVGQQLYDVEQNHLGKGIPPVCQLLVGQMGLTLLSKGDAKTPAGTHLAGYKYRDLLMWYAGSDVLTILPVALGRQDASIPVKVKLYTSESRIIRDLMLYNARAYRAALMRELTPKAPLFTTINHSRASHTFILCAP